MSWIRVFLELNKSLFLKGLLLLMVFLLGLQMGQLVPGEPERPQKRTFAECGKDIIESIAGRLGQLLPSTEAEQDAVGVMLRSTLLRPECVQPYSRGGT